VVAKEIQECTILGWPHGQVHFRIEMIISCLLISSCRCHIECISWKPVVLDKKPVTKSLHQGRVRAI